MTVEGRRGGRHAVPAVVICVENLPPRRDRRVWREACALRDAGFEAVVVGQAVDEDLGRQVIDGVHLYTYPAPVEGHSIPALLREYVVSYVRTAAMLRTVRRRHRVVAVQVCNPPDLFFPLARGLRRRGIAFVFDHHDLVPELFATRYGDRHRWAVAILRWLERRSLRAADHVIATNQSYRRLEIERGGVDPSRVTVVRNGPDTSVMFPRPVRPELRRGRRHLLVWFGNMGRQDGADTALDAVEELVHRRGRRDVHLVFCGRGEMLETLRRLVRERGLDDVVTLTGWVSDEVAFDHLSTASIGISADPPGPLNDVSTMNKTMEYMAFRLPVVAFDLPETRVSAGDAALYADPDDGLADVIEQLLDDDDLRAELGRRGLTRVETELAWHHQAAAYVDVYRRLVAAEIPQPAPVIDPVEVPA